MNKFVKFAMMSSAFVGAQIATVPAMAQTAPSGVYSGLVTVKKGLELECTLTLDVDATTVEVSLTPPTDPRCAALGFVGNPYSYTYVPGPPGTFTIHNVYVDTITLGDCAGDISAEWDGTNFIIDTILPTATTGTPDCTILGVIP